MSLLSDYLFHEEPGIQLYCGDCRDVLPLLDAEGVDLVLTDPPYNVGKDYGAYDDDQPPADYVKWLGGILAECERVTRDGVVFFPGVVNAFDVREVLAPTTLRPVRMLGWHKREFAGDMWRGKSPSPFFNKVFGHWGRDFCVVSSTHGDPLRKLHPCPKPLLVVRWLTGLFCPEGGVVLDPFVGTGTTLLSAKDSGRRAIGIEIEAKYCELTVKRLRQGVLPL